MRKFAFIMHPLDAKRDISRKYPWAKYLPTGLLHYLLTLKSPMLISKITGVESLTGAQTEGWFVGCPLTPEQMITLPLEKVYKKIIDAGKMAQDLGAEIVGLGAFTSVVGDGGITIAKNLDIAVTTGNSYTVATAIEGAVKAAELMSIDLPNAHLAIVGAAGSIGRTCSIILAPKVGKISLIGRSLDKLEVVKNELSSIAKGEVVISTDVKSALSSADIIITVSSAAETIIEPEYLKSGSVICDVARPRDVSKRVVEERNDILVIEGGVVKVPGPVKLNFNFGFPPLTAYACMSETMMLALEGRIENFTLGKEVSPEQVVTTQELAKKHGFELAGFRSFEKAVTQETIDKVRANVKRSKITSNP